MYPGMGMGYPPMGQVMGYQGYDQMSPAYDSVGSMYSPMSMSGMMPYASSYGGYMGYPGSRRAFDYGGANMGYPLRPFQDFATNSLMYFITDKDNFQPQGCAWDGVRNRCTDVLNACKGGCRDFSHDTTITHDCRCVPFGYAALLGLGRK